MGLLCAAPLRAAERTQLLVVQSDDASVALVDPRSGETDTTIRVGVGPHRVAVSPNGRLAVVSNRGLAQDGSSLSVIDVEARRLARTITLALKEPQLGGEPLRRLFHRPNGVCFTHDGERVLVTCEREHALLIVDVAEGKVIAAIDTEQEHPGSVQLSRDGQTAWVANEQSGSLSVIDLNRRRVVKVIEMGGGTRGLALHPDQPELWATNVETNSISIVDLEALKETREFPCGAHPTSLAFVPSAGHVLLVNCQSSSISVFSSGSGRMIREVKLAKLEEEQAEAHPLPPGYEGFRRSSLPQEVLVHPDGTTAWVTCFRNARVAEIDLESFEVRRYLEVGGGPIGVAWSRFEDDRVSAK